MRKIILANAREIEVLTVTEADKSLAIVLKTLTTEECQTIFSDKAMLKALTYVSETETKAYGPMLYTGLGVDAVGIITVNLVEDTEIEKQVEEVKAEAEAAAGDITDLQLVAAGLYEENLTLNAELQATKDALAVKDTEVTDLQLAMTEMFEAITLALEDPAPEVPVEPEPVIPQPADPSTTEEV